MPQLLVRPMRVWPTPKHRSRQITSGYYWHWECRLCHRKTRDLIPSLPMAYDDAVRHLEGCTEGDDD